MAAATGLGHGFDRNYDAHPLSFASWRRNLPGVAVGKNIGLLALLALALLFRLGWGLSRASDAESLGSLPDQSEYLSLGWNLIENTTLVFFDDRFHQEVHAYR